MFLCLRINLIRVNVTDHHQGCIVWRIPHPVPLSEVINLEVLQVIHPADNRNPVRAAGIGRGLELLVGQRLRIVFGAHAALFHDHLDLFQDFIIGDGQIPHPVCFEFKTHRQAAFFHGLEISRVILTGKRVFAPAVFRNDFREFTVWMRFGAFEHHVFQHM